MISLCVMTRRQLSWIRGFSWSMGMSNVKYLILRSPPAHHQDFMAQHARYFTPSVHRKTTQCWKWSSLSSQYAVGQPVTSLGLQRRDLKVILAALQYVNTLKVRGAREVHIIIWQLTHQSSLNRHFPDHGGLILSLLVYFSSVFTRTLTPWSAPEGNLFHTESVICVYLEQQQLVNQTKINCQILW